VATTGDCILTAALPFCHATLKAKRSLPETYPTELKSIGDHIRKRRLDLGLLQRDVAGRIGVDEGTVWAWESNRNHPKIHVMPRVIAFLGYVPGGDATPSTLSERLVRMRTELGLSWRNLAVRIGVDETTLRRRERGKMPTFRRHIDAVQRLLTCEGYCFPVGFPNASATDLTRAKKASTGSSTR
jgi:transcriptional regulator with XRE-family HTH domain